MVLGKDLFNDAPDMGFVKNRAMAGIRGGGNLRISGVVPLLN